MLLIRKNAFRRFGARSIFGCRSEKMERIGKYLVAAWFQRILDRSADAAPPETRGGLCAAPKDALGIGAIAGYKRQKQDAFPARGEPPHARYRQMRSSAESGGGLTQQHWR